MRCEKASSFYVATTITINNDELRTGIGRDAKAVPLVVHPLALVLAPVGPDIGAGSRTLRVAPVAIVDVTAWPREDTIAVALIICDQT